MSPASASNVTYYVATADGTATAAGNDYVARAATGQTMLAGATSKTFGVTIKGDTTVEASEAFTAVLSGAKGATIYDASGTATITNDD
jgi:hypothetical protein